MEPKIWGGPHDASLTRFWAESNAEMTNQSFFVQKLTAAIDCLFFIPAG